MYGSTDDKDWLESQGQIMVEVPVDELRNSGNGGVSSLVYISPKDFERMSFNNLVKLPKPCPNCKTIMTDIGEENKLEAMNLSLNTLIINSLSIEPIRMDINNPMFAGGRVAKIAGRVEFRCPVTHKLVAELSNKVSGNVEYSQKEALKSAIQNFLSGQVRGDYGIFDIENECDGFDIENECDGLDTKIHEVDIQLQEPFKSLFEGLLDITKWEFPRQQLLGL